MAKPCRRGCKYPRRKKAPVNPPVSLAADRSGLPLSLPGPRCGPPRQAAAGPLRSLHLPQAALPCGPFTQGGLWYGGMNGHNKPPYLPPGAAARRGWPYRPPLHRSATRRGPMWASAPTGKSLPDTFDGGTLLPQAFGRGVRTRNARPYSGDGGIAQKICCVQDLALVPGQFVRPLRKRL